MTVIPIKVYALIVLILSTFILNSGTANAEPLYRAQQGSLSITLYSEPCDLKEVSNLPKKAVWVQDGKTYAGCWGLNPDLGLVMAYFDDKTVAAIPAQIFARVTSL